jgi:hypothetical protein
LSENVFPPSIAQSPTIEMRSLPDPDLSLRDASDFIFDSALARKALSDPEPRDLAIFLRDLIQAIYRLTLSCHLPEFTDHGLGHLCSLVDRLSQWSTAGADPILISDQISPQEASVLLMATLLHDIGMLSQRPEDLPGEHDSKPIQDIPTWVRRTHVSRMSSLVDRLFRDTSFAADLTSPIFQRAIRVAQAHEKWPWQWAGFSFPTRDAGLAAMLAVADLLDEDSLRCDSATLLRHRYGSAQNCAHWIRHGLTDGRILVQGGRIVVSFVRPPNTDLQIAPVFAALRNHYRLVLLYLAELGQVNARLVSVDFTPPTGIPDKENDIEWWRLPEFRFQSALRYHLLDTFMAEARVEPGLDAVTKANLTAAGLEPVDLAEYHRIRSMQPPRTPLEQSFHALLAGA